MLLTINTDASFHPQLKYGAYAFWAICNDFKITKSDSFKTKCINPHDAEARCIINALKVVMSTQKHFTRIIINTDSLNAIAILTNDNTHIRRYIPDHMKHWKYLRNTYHLTVRNKNINIQFKHVKAHSGVNDARSFVNEWCDTEAKRNMWKKVNSLKN